MSLRGHDRCAHTARLNCDVGEPAGPGRLIESLRVDRRLALKNLRTGLIAGAIAIIVFALSWVVGLIY